MRWDGYVIGDGGVIGEADERLDAGPPPLLSESFVVGDDDILELCCCCVPLVAEFCFCCRLVDKSSAASAYGGGSPGFLSPVLPLRLLLPLLKSSGFSGMGNLGDKRGDKC